MNLNLTNLDYTQWTKNDWLDAYTAYCKTNLFGPKTKKEYYDWVRSRLDRQKSLAEPLSKNLINKWTSGFKKASVWAKKRCCDMNGRMLSDVRADAEDHNTREIAERAEDIAVDTQQRLDYLIERVRK